MGGELQVNATHDRRIQDHAAVDSNISCKRVVHAKPATCELDIANGIGGVVPSKTVPHPIDVPHPVGVVHPVGAVHPIGVIGAVVSFETPKHNEAPENS
jgi:hypothetical protein